MTLVNRNQTVKPRAVFVRGAWRVRGLGIDVISRDFERALALWQGGTLQKQIAS